MYGEPMLVTSDHISEASRAVIRAASAAELERIQHRTRRIHLLRVVMFVATALLALALALATRRHTWALVLPFLLLSHIARRNQEETRIDLMKVALCPSVIDEIRNSEGRF
jgi:hypothetical protein